MYHFPSVDPESADKAVAPMITSPCNCWLINTFAGSSIEIPSSRVRLTPAAVQLLDGPQRFVKITGTISTGSLLFRQVFFLPRLSTRSCAVQRGSFAHSCSSLESRTRAVPKAGPKLGWSVLGCIEADYRSYVSFCSGSRDRQN